MSGKAATVLWLGLILVALNLMSQWSTIKSVLFSGSPTSGSGSSGGGSTKGPSVTIPIDPFLPISPHITIPLSSGGGTSGVQAV
jgi:hypothetical protein